MFINAKNITPELIEVASGIELSELEIQITPTISNAWSNREHSSDAGTQVYPLAAGVFLVRDYDFSGYPTDWGWMNKDVDNWHIECALPEMYGLPLPTGQESKFRLTADVYALTGRTMRSNWKVRGTDELPADWERSTSTPANTSIFSEGSTRLSDSLTIYENGGWTGSKNHSDRTVWVTDAERYPHLADQIQSAKEKSAAKPVSFLEKLRAGI